GPSGRSTTRRESSASSRFSRTRSRLPDALSAAIEHSTPRRDTGPVSAENVAIARSLWAPFQGLDATAIDRDDESVREALGAPFSPDVELRWSSTGPDREVYRGPDGVIQAYREWVEPFSEYRVEA